MITGTLGFLTLTESQAGAEFVYNENIYKLDAVTQLSVYDYENDPPVTAIDGDVWVVGETGTGDWENKDNHIAYYVQTGWKFITPKEGMRAYVHGSGLLTTYKGLYIKYNGTAWEVVAYLTDVITGHIVAPLHMDYCLDLKAIGDYEITKIIAETGGGTCDLEIIVNTTTQTGVLSVDDTMDSITMTASVTADDSVYLSVTNISDALDLQFQVELTKATF